MGAARKRARARSTHRRQHLFRAGPRAREDQARVGGRGDQRGVEPSARGRAVVQPRHVRERKPAGARIVGLKGESKIRWEPIKDSRRK